MCANAIELKERMESRIKTEVKVSFLPGFNSLFIMVDSFVSVNLILLLLARKRMFLVLFRIKVANFHEKFVGKIAKRFFAWILYKGMKADESTSFSLAANDMEYLL